MPKNSMRPAVRQKASRKTLVKALEKAGEDIDHSRKREQANFQVLFMFGVRLREVAPDDLVFEAKTITPQFLEVIDKEVQRRITERAKAKVESIAKKSAKDKEPEKK